MSRNAAHFASRASRVQDAFAFQTDRNMGRTSAPEYSREIFVLDRMQVVRRPVIDRRKVIPMDRAAVNNAAEIARNAELEAKRQAAKDDRAEQARKATEVAEAAQRKQRELVATRSELTAFIQKMDDAAIAYAWNGSRDRAWLVQNTANADLNWISLVREGLESAIVRHQEAEGYRRRKIEDEQSLLRKERDELASLFQHADMAAVDSIWGSGRSRWTFVCWARDLNLEEVRSVRARLEAGIKSYAEAKAKLDPKSKHFDVLAHLKANAGKPVSAAASCPSKEELEALGRKVNGEKKEKTMVYYFDSPNRTLSDRILALSPVTVARLHTEKPVPHTWPTIERILNAVRGAKTKFEGRVIEDKGALIRIQTFVAWCEQG